MQQVSSEKELRRKAQAQGNTNEHFPMKTLPVFSINTYHLNTHIILYYAGEAAERHLQRVAADLAAVTATPAATKMDKTESAALIASLRTENKTLQKSLEDAQLVLSKESAFLSPSSSKSSTSDAEKALRAENKSLQIALEEAQKDLDEFLSLFNSEKERFATEMAMMMDHEQQLLKENKRLDMAVERLNDCEASNSSSR